jgi:DNA primase
VNGPNAGGDFKAQVLQATDIVELIGQSVALKRRGKDFVGLCPFHQEKTPSFKVDPAKQYFYCFGCKASGSAIDFVMKRDRVVFIDALRALGERAGLEMPRFGVSREKSSERQQLLDACSAACALFEKLLSHPEQGKAARDYLAGRGFDAETIKRFQIGFAPNAWDTLLNSPVGRKFPPQILALAGLLKPRQQGEGYYDTFRNRVMFPIRDDNGRVIAFGGRVMPGSEDPAKYLNSPETPLFSKGKSVFGLDLARQRIVETRLVAVVEGYTDVVMAHQYGVSNVVATLGTAMTESHVNVLRRFADKVVLLFDGDEAGETAVNRAVELFMTQPVDFLVASLPDGVDPDEYVMQRGAEAFGAMLTSAPSVLQFMVKKFKQRWDANENDIPAREKAMAAFIDPFIKARGEGAMSLDRWAAVIAAVSKAIGVSTSELHRKYAAQAKLIGRKAAQAAAGREPTNFNQSGVNQPGDDRSIQARPLAVRAGRPLPVAQEMAERHILGILLWEPERWQAMQQLVEPADFTEPTRRALAEVYWHRQRDEGEPVFNEFLSQLTEPALQELAAELAEEVKTLPSLDDAIAGALLHLSEARRRREAEKHTARLRRTDEQLGEQDEVSLLAKLQENARRPDLRRVGS